MKMKNQLTNRILSLVLACVMVTGLLPTMAFAESGKHTVTVNAGEDGQVSTDGTSWSNSVAVTVNDGETLDGKVQYKADEGYTFDGVIPSSKIVSVAAGAGHTVLLDADGNVWTAGWNRYGQLGRNGDTSTFAKATKGIGGVRIIAIAAGYYHTVLLDENGNVWTAGDNQFGQLGRETSSDSDSTFKQVADGISRVKITAIAAGDSHTVLLDADGNVWTAGYNEYGQLGRETSSDRDSTFRQVTDGISGVKITAIVAVYYHTVLLDANGNVWTAGYNKYGQLGRDENIDTTNSNPTFTKVTVGDGVKIKAIAAGYYHTILLDENNNVWTAGYNKYGQLGRDENAGTTQPNSTFKQVTDGISGVKITAIAAGRSHTVLLDENNSVWTAGYNEYGQLCRETSSDRDSTFTQVTDGISGIKITAIVAGSSHTVLLDENNSVWTAGYNYYDQLGRDENAGTIKPNPTFKQAAVNPNAITFEELLNIPIYNDSVFLVKFKDIQGPVITGLENNKTYCDAVEFEVSDNNDIASVKAGNTELTESNGKYTLEKGAGTVTIVATDKAKNETTITVTVNDGHTYEWQSNGDGTHTRYCTVTGCGSYEDGDCTGGQATYFKKAVCDYCKEGYGSLLTDTTAPTGEISIGTNKWNSFLNTITFGLFIKNTRSVTITETDDSYNHNGYTDDKAVKVEYLLSDKGLSKTGLAGKKFTEYNSAFSINPDNKYVVYVKLTDHAGNVTYISSNGIVLDATAPVISGIENGKTYCEAQTVTVTEEYIESVKVNGTAVTLDANNQFILNPAEGTQTVVVTDKAGNETAVTVTVNNGHTAGNDDGNCSTPVYCIYHPNTVVVKAKSHDFSGEWNKDKDGHWHICQNDGCTVPETKASHSGTDDGDCTTAVICECGYIITAAKSQHSYGAWQSNGDDTHIRYCTVDGCNGSEDGDCEGGQATYFKKAVCDYCKEGYGSLLTDTTAPTGEISIGTNKWNSFLNTITFGLFIKNTRSVTITETDDSYNHNGYTDDKAVKVEYLLSDKGLSKTGLAGKKFTEYNSAFSINPDNKYVVYVKLTDHAGNVTYISSNGIVLDATAPVITGVTDGAVHYTTQKAVVTDDNLKSITLNGVIVSGTTVTLDGNTDEVYTIVATDKSDNSTTVTVTMKPISSLAQSIEDVNGENVRSSNKEEIDAVKESVGEIDTSNATDSEKEALNDINNRCDELLDIVDEAQKVTETENIKNAEEINPDNVTENDRDALENAKADLEKALEDNGGNYTEDEKKAIEDEIKRIDDALEVIGNVEAVEELIDKLPENITKNDENAIKAADDAYNALSDYEKSLVDEDIKKSLDDAKAALAELNKPADTDRPQTGDNSNMFLWIALLFISGGAVITLTVVDRKRRTASKR